MRRFFRAFSVVLIVAGSLLLIDAAVTYVWQEPFTALYNKWQQGKLNDRLKELQKTRDLSPRELQTLKLIRSVPKRVAFQARILKRHAKPGDPLGRIKIDKIGVNKIFVEGTDEASLSKGPGHYPETAMPGQGSTVGIAGHRTTYGAPFRHVDQLKIGDVITLDMPYAKFFYRVEKTRIVDPSATWVVHPIGRERLVLSACHPPYSAAKRIIIFARLDHLQEH